MDAIIPFTYYNEHTMTNIAGITYLITEPSLPTKKPSTFQYNNNTPIHFVFAHATGLCKEVFVDVVHELRSRGITSPITSIDHADHGDSTHHLSCDWHLLALDLYAVIENVIRPNDPNKLLIGVGHSMGGTVSALVEIAHPATYACLILLEPVLPQPPYKREAATALSEITLKRKSVFPDKEGVRSALSAKSPFKLWTKGSFDSYVEHGFKHSIIDGKEVVELKATKESEAEFYRMGPAHGGRDLVPRINIPLLILKGSDSIFQPYDDIVSKCKHAYYEEVKGGSHFFPMELPNIVADKTITFIKTHVKTGLESRL